MKNQYGTKMELPSKNARMLALAISSRRQSPYLLNTSAVPNILQPETVPAILLPFLNDYVMFTCYLSARNDRNKSNAAISAQNFPTFRFPMQFFVTINLSQVLLWHMNNDGYPQPFPWFNYPNVLVFLLSAYSIVTQG